MAAGWLIITRDRHIQHHGAEIAGVRDNDANTPASRAISSYSATAIRNMATIMHMPASTSRRALPMRDDVGGQLGDPLVEPYLEGLADASVAV